MYSTCTKYNVKSIFGIVKNEARILVQVFYPPHKNSSGLENSRVRATFFSVRYDATSLK